MARPCCTPCCTTFFLAALFHYYYKLVGTIINVHRPNLSPTTFGDEKESHEVLEKSGYWHRFQLFGVWGSELGIDATCIDHLVQRSG